MLKSGVGTEVNRKGFTLLELLVVLVIIGILLGILLPAFSRLRETARRKRYASDQDTIPMAVHNYYHETGIWPVPNQNDLSEDEDDPLVFVNNNYEVVNRLCRPNIDFPDLEGISFLNLGDYCSDDDGNITSPWGKPYRFIFVARTSNYSRIGFELDRQ